MSAFIIQSAKYVGPTDFGTRPGLVEGSNQGSLGRAFLGAPHRDALALRIRSSKIEFVDV